ncbi:MAG TPA: hypothetical protein VMM37_02670 [Bacteroidota bacterium]|nr:hypothetical protein [Bacteroidota bacterium]
MIDGFIFVIHFAACVYGFFRYRKEGLSEGILAVAFVVIIFSVGWTITTMLVKLVYPYDLIQAWVRSLQGSAFSRLLAKELRLDTFSLVILTIGESFFYYFFLRTVAKNGEGRPEE